MNCKKSALSYWCFPRLVKVTSSCFYFYLIAFYFCIFINMLQVGYCSWLLLLWLTALYLVTGLGGQDNTLRYLFLHIIFPWHTKCLHINDLILGIALPVMAFSILSFPMVL